MSKEWDRMEKLSVKKPFTILVAVIMVLVLGVVSVMGMTTDLLPNMSLPYLIVVTTYPGASPERVETDVVKPLESALGTVTGVENVCERASFMIAKSEGAKNLEECMVLPKSGKDGVTVSIMKIDWSVRFE